MPKEFIIKGYNVSGTNEKIRLSSSRTGYGFRLKEFKLWGSTNLGATSQECWGILSRGPALDPISPNFNDDSIIGVSVFMTHTSPAYPPQSLEVIDDLVILTQDLTIAVRDTSDAEAVNWFLKFEEIKISGAAEAAANYQALEVRSS
tara:strand:+ start:201 stop:641 length:441 start_codon:yes stop_codon:yes gene_type:complete